MNSLLSVFEAPAQVRLSEHGGRGSIQFRRVLDTADFAAPIDFVDYTVIPPGSEIGWHRHVGNEEIYFIVAGTPLMRVDEQEARLARGSLAIVRDGGSHALINDTSDDVEILVVQVRV